MSGSGPSTRRQRGGSVIRGLLLLGCGRAEGFNCFEDSRDAFLAALSPQIGFLLVAAMLLLLQAPTATNASMLLVLLCSVLLPPVITHAMARLWRRDDRWRRYATATLWSSWLIIPAYVPALLLASILLQLGVGRLAAEQVILLLIAGYFLWLYWFMARRGLGIGGVQAALTVAAVLVGMFMLCVAVQPVLVAMMPELH